MYKRQLLKSLDNKIAVNNTINKNLEQQAQTIFNREFLSLDSIPDDWKKSSLLGIADYLNGLAMQKYRPKDGEQGLPVLKIKELRQGSCDSNSELCSPSIRPEYIAVSYTHLDVYKRQDQNTTSGINV